MISKIKLILISIVFALIIGLGSIAYFQYNKIKEIETELFYAVNNNKAYELENSNLKGKTIEYQYTIQQLNNSQDSLIQKLNAARKQLKIKDKNIQELHYIAAQTQKTDSIFVHDTIFMKGVVVDTLLKDEWSSLRLNLEYPNKIKANYSFRNSTIVAVSTIRETVDPPDKCWLVRLFQKKHTLAIVEIIQENPYCETTKEKHISVIK